MDEQFEYKTGRTEPRKSSHSILAVVLMLAIFLCGAVSIFSIMNIRLSRQPPTISFAVGQAETKPTSLTLAGMALEEPDPVYLQLHGLPQGLYVAQVEPGSQAETLGIQPGDVLTRLNEEPVTTLEAAEELLAAKIHCQLVLWRDGQELPVTVFQ